MDCSDTSGQRTRSEMIIKSIATHAATLIAFGHLGSLRNVSERNRRWYYDIIGFFFMPTLPVAQLLYYSFRNIKNKWNNQNGGSFTYYLASTLGVHVLIPLPEDERTVPLVDVDCGDVNSNPPEPRHPGRQWVGRVVVLLIFIVQSGSASILYIRRCLYDRVGYLDHRNGLVVLGGLFTGIIGLAITVLNHSWKHISDKSLSADKNDSLDTLKEYFVSGMLYLLWILLVHREIYQIPLDYISSPLEIFYLITINTVIILTIPISLLLFSVPGSHGSSMLISLAAKHILLCSVGLSIATLVFSIAELTGFQCPTSSEYWGPLCWKDPLAERLWTF